MINYQITIGYKAIIQVNVKAADEAEAKKEGLEIFKKELSKMYKGKLELQDDNYKVDGILNMDETWLMW